ncbi:3'-phosphoesterase [Candidatus Gottesmanbacteria bacterium]|nr:3'-phosphoesterase [Candidatus Gottesmanbacteria bacterium]
MKQLAIIGKKSDSLVFVIHKHAATRLHYDFRLQIGNVMPSWAIPKGPSLDPTVKRLAMQTPDHDLTYRHFEGIIPPDNYGAGTVMIWDTGAYIPEIELEKGRRELVKDREVAQKVMKEGMKKGELKFQLFGSKLKGSFALIKTRGFGPKNSWLLIKHKDEYVQKDYNANDYDFSAKTKRTLTEISQNVIHNIKTTHHAFS